MNKYFIFCSFIVALAVVSATPTVKPTVSPSVSRAPSTEPSSFSPSLSQRPTMAPSWIGVDGVVWVTDVAGTPGILGDSGDGGPATSATLNEPSGLWTNSNGLLFITDSKSSKIRTVDSNGVINTFAGSSLGFSEAVAATVAKLNVPSNVMGDTLGNVYITDTQNNCIRAVDTSGTMWTVVNQACNDIYFYVSFYQRLK